MSDIIKAIILGIIEGLTEFLPISSTGHLILAADVMNLSGEKFKTFEVVIQFGAVLAVFVLYFKRFLALLRFNFKSGLNIVHFMLAMLPASLIGLLLHDVIKKYLFSSSTVVVGLILGACLMLYVDFKKREITAQELDDITYKQALMIGVFQILALWPGFSRSGSTISGGMLAGVSQKAAAEFTFLISVPIMAAASLLDLVQNRAGLSTSDIPLFLIGLCSAFIVAMIAVVTFINLIKKLKLRYFAYYRIVLAIIFIFIVL